MSLKSFDFTVNEKNDGATVRDFLRRSCGITARSMTVLKYSDGGIFRAEQSLRSCDIVHAGDVITLKLPGEANEITPVEGDLDILFEDDYLLLIDKPAHMPVHPTKTHQLDTLANIVSYHQRSRGESYIFRALNRLDKDTSGCVLIAKDRLTYALVKDNIEKSYVAICEGIIKEAGTIDRPIGLADSSKIERVVRDDGSAAITHYRPIETGNQHTYLRLVLETGRTHQIRCHMSSIGHPLAGDDLYGGSRRFIDRTALHCDHLCFRHPFENMLYSYHTLIPDVFFQIIREG